MDWSELTWVPYRLTMGGRRSLSPLDPNDYTPYRVDDGRQSFYVSRLR
jgi:hypothetical protein